MQIETLKKKISLEDFATISLIGKGSYASVILVRHKESNRLYALKILKKKNIMTKNQKRHIKIEKEILKETPEHPFLVQMYSSFQTDKKLFFVLEYCPGGELFSLLKKS